MTSLFPNALTPQPLGKVTPLGWLSDQLRIQADGLSGHLDEFWPDVADSQWIGGAAEGWERGPYWLDGLVPLAVLLDDARLKAKAAHWVNYILTHQHDDGWLGPKNDPREGSGEVLLDPWPLFIIFKALTQWQEATGDTRIIPALLRACRRIDTLLGEKPLDSWAKMRWPDLVLSLHWLFDRTGEEWLLGLADKAERQGYDWRDHFADFRFTGKSQEWTLENHVVNNAMALKAPALRLRANGDAAESLAEATAAIAMLDTYHGQTTGVFTGDESLAGKSPSQGTELCAVVEYMFSLERLLAAFAHVPFGDRLERIAYNALPGTFTPEMWAHQYDQQANQILCIDAPRPWTNNGPDSNLFGLEPHFGCCTSNLHQGWPKFTSHLWMQTPDGGLAAVAYGPSEVRAIVAGSVEVTLMEETEYPFRDTVRFTVQSDAPVRFPLRLRIPEWAREATIQIGSETARPAIPGTFHTLDRLWTSGETIALHLPMSIQLDHRDRGAVSILHGPLVFSLKVGEEFRRLRGELPHADWEVYPTTPWNYGLALPSEAPMTVFTINQSPIGPRPFDPAAAPITLTAPARRLPQWASVENCAAPPPDSPVPTDTPVELITLIPYGSAHLRVTEFPVVIG